MKSNDEVKNSTIKNDADHYPRLQRFNLRSALGFIISGFLLWLTFKKSGLTLADIKLEGEQWAYFAAAIGVFVFSLWLYALRAKLIWTDRSKNGIAVSTYGSLIIGNFYNSILPGNMGDGVRAWHFGKKNGVNFSRALSGIITEKWLDAQVFAVFVIVLFTIKPFVSNYILYALAYTSLVVIILAIIYVIMRRYRKLEKQLWSVVFLFKKAGTFLFRTYINTNQRLDSMKTNGVIGKYLLYFMVIFALNVLQFFFLQKAAGVAGPVASLYSSFLVSLSMMIIAFVPSAPGNIGVLHYGIYAVLLLAARQYGIEPKPADLQTYALFAIYVHLSFFIPEIIMGGLFMIKERKTLFTNSNQPAFS